jgi:type I restriction enzyme M protein
MEKQIPFSGLTFEPASKPLDKRDVGAFFRAHSAIRDVDGFHADKALDELCKVIFSKLWDELHSVNPLFTDNGKRDDLIWSDVSRLYEQARDYVVEREGDPSLLGALSEPIQLSPACLKRVVAALAPLSLRDSNADLKGTAFQQVVSSAARFGMGQYFTPEPVVDCTVRMLRPRSGERIIDPFCGSGRFLSAAYQFIGDEGRAELHGIEKSERMVRVGLTEILLHGRDAIHFHKADSLRSDTFVGLLEPQSFDLVLTNPPFGSLLESTQHLAQDFVLARGRDAVPLEVLGLELASKLLKKGGRVGIVLPESILNTKQMQDVRNFIMEHFIVRAVLSLPPQTFAPFDGVGKASVLFLERDCNLDSSSVFFAAPEHVGYDNTGRHVEANDLNGVPGAYALFANTAMLPSTGPYASVQADTLRENFSYTSVRAAEAARTVDSVPLWTLCKAIMCGGTPPKSEYTQSGIRILKVGDLTSEGLDWEPRQRGFVSEQHFRRRGKPVELDDILLTSAAHHPRYIGQKVDIVDNIPEEFASKGVCFVAELLLIRVDKSKCDPYLLLLWLRSEIGYNALQGCVSGQTAHLYSDAVERIGVPSAILQPTAGMKRAVELLRESLDLRARFKAGLRDATELFTNEVVCQSLVPTPPRLNHDDSAVPIRKNRADSASPSPDSSID